VTATRAGGTVATAGGETAERLEREAARRFVAAAASLQERGQRERYRRLLEDAGEQATRALLAAEAEARVASNDERAVVTSLRARSTLAMVYAARAEDALHGAAQLSLSAQRAPTVEACDAGWRRVETLATSAEAFAGMAATVASALGQDARGAAARARSALSRAEAVAGAARRIVEQRNHAYTFHTDAGFSFGEGWYLAAAAVLAGVTIQIEPGGRVLEAETFLQQAGLTGLLRPYRPRPRAMKHLPEIVARAFRADPGAAQHKLRAALLGTEPIPARVADWVDRRLAPAREIDQKKVLVWIRDGVHHAHRNTTFAELEELTKRVRRAGLVPVLTGDALRGGEIPEGALDLILFWKDPIFGGADRRRAQLQFFEHLRAAHGLVGQLGVTTAGMDGPALLGLPTLYLTDAPNVRMRTWVGAVPDYRELVRESGYLEVVSAALSKWAFADSTQSVNCESSRM
jgi:hypothetical protein